ncbi:MAG TPA: GntR family transcriptional regulator [Desulfosarcina sp.]|nr:GntR family transcriptional regulator [Desulfosarcina sp.]
MNPEIYREIKRRILFLEYAPGQILNENTLAGEFGVSRTPMREVLYRLAWEDLARIIPRTGTMVAQIEFQTMMHTYQARLGIEGEVGRLCAELGTKDHLAALERVRKACAVLTDDKQPGTLVEIDRRLRRIVHDAASNPVLKSVSDHLYTLTFRLWYVTLDKGDWQQEVREMMEEIEATLAGMRARDGEATARARRDALVRHLDRIRGKYLGVHGDAKW